MSSKMSSRRSGPLPLDKNFMFLNTKGLCLLCYEECPVQTLEKRRVTTQTSVNFTRLVSRYLSFNIDDVIVSPLKKVGRKCVIEKEQQTTKKIDKVGFELCDRCASLAHAFCQVQFQVQFHQMILDRCVRSISEIIKDANKKSVAELFTMSEDGDAIRKQQKTFTRLTLGGLRSANMLRNKLYKKSLHKLSRSFPIIKLKRICKSGDWIPFLNKQDNKDVSKTLPADSKDVMFASLLGCVVSLWIVLSLSFINPDEYAKKVKEEKSHPKKPPPMPLINCDELEIEIKFPVKKKLPPQEIFPTAFQKSKRRSSRSSSSSSTIIAQQPLPPPSTSNFQPVVIHKHPNHVVQITKQPIGSQHQLSQSGSTEYAGNAGQFNYDPASSWKPKSSKYPTTLQPIPPAQPPPTRVPVIVTPSTSSAQPHSITHPTPPYPHQSHQYPLPTTMSSSAPSSSNYPTYSYPSATSSSSSHLNSPPPLGSVSSEYPQYTDLNNSTASNYNYSYNFTTYNYNSSSTWPTYNTAPVEPPPPHSYPPPVNGGYNPYNSNVPHSSGSRGDSSSYNGGYDYGYDYNNYIPPSQSIPNNYHQQNPPNQYMPQSHATGSMYTDSTGGGGYNNDTESTSYTTLLPPASSSNSYVASTATATIPMEVDNTNTSTSDEPSLTHEDPQSLDSESSSMNGDDQLMDGENDNEANSNGQQPPQLIFPETHWRQQPSTGPPISCNKPGCFEQFVTQGQFQLHLRTHGEFQCSFCHLTFSKAHNLAQHEKMRHCKNTGVGKNKCPRCDYASTSQYKYFLHFLTFHLNIPLYDKPCDVCNKQFILGTKVINRKNHFRIYHDVEGKDPSSIFTCKGCSAPFLKEAQLRDHQPNCTAIASVSSSESTVEEITYNTALATADQIVM